MWLTRSLWLAVVAGLFVAAVGGVASAAEVVGHAHPWQVDVQEPATAVQERVKNLHDLLLIISVAICALVLALLLYVLVRFSAKNNPVPSRTSHNTLVEVVWTVLPVIILIVIAIPSFKLLYFEEQAPEAELTIKAIGHQWYWSYEYPDNGGFTFDAVMIPKDEITGDQLRLLETDNRVVVPVDTVVRVQVTADDVLHSWAMPAFGVKKDAVPGRLNETWFRAERVGLYYGQCSEICGTYHAFMPIALEVVSKEDFERWVGEAKEKFARAGGSAVQVAGAAAAQAE